MAFVEFFEVVEVGTEGGFDLIEVEGVVDGGVTVEGEGGDAAGDHGMEADGVFAGVADLFFDEDEVETELTAVGGELGDLGADGDGGTLLAGGERELGAGVFGEGFLDAGFEFLEDLGGVGAGAAAGGGDAIDGVSGDAAAFLPIPAGLGVGVGHRIGPGDVDVVHDDGDIVAGVAFHGGVEGEVGGGAGGATGSGVEFGEDGAAGFTAEGFGVEGGGEDGLITLVEEVFEVGAIAIGGGEAVPGLLGGAGEEGMGAEVEGGGGAAFGFGDFGEFVGGRGRGGVGAEGGFEGFAGLGGAAIGVKSEAEGFLVELGLGGPADFGGAAGGIESGGGVLGGEEFGGEGLEEAGLVVAFGVFGEGGDGFGGGGGVVFDESDDELALGGGEDGGGEIGELEELLEGLDARGGVLGGGGGGEAFGEFGEGGRILGEDAGQKKERKEGEQPESHQQVVPYLISMKHLIAVIWLLAAAVAPAQDNVNAVLWQQTAAEYRASTIQAFRAATAVLPRALADRQWTAALEQRGMDAERLAALPPAIIVDVDETIVDNAPAAARDIRERNGVFDPKAWTQWTSEAKAKALAGAREFLGEARLRGVTVFYVTNRGLEEAAATRRNLVEQGFEVLDLNNTLIPSTLLVKDESKKWGSDKTTRRAIIARNYRIVMLCGDDLNDFVSVYGLSRAERDVRARLYDEWWGERWILLPNPTYGTWERALGQDKRGALDLAGQ